MEDVTRRYFSGDPLADALSTGREAVRNASQWSMTVGVLQIIVGAIALYYALFATITTVYLIGTALILGGIFQGISAFSARKWSAALLDVLSCVLYLVAGFATFRQPIIAAAAITLVLASIFMFQGVLRIVGAFALRPQMRRWVFLNGLVTFALGLIVFAEWPASATWLIGIMIGVDLVFSGITMVTGGAHLHRMTSEPKSAPPPLGTPAPA